MDNSEFQKIVLEKLTKIESDVAEIKAQTNRIEDQTVKLSEFNQGIREKFQEIVNL